MDEPEGFGSSGMKLTSSNFAAAMGLNPYQTRQKLWRVMTSREERDPMNEFMQWGVDNEFRAVAAVEAITGLIFSNTGENQHHYDMVTYGDGGRIPKYGTTPDGNCGSTGLETKCPQTLKDEPPVMYLPQVQGQCWIAGFDTVVFGQWTEEETRVWTIARSDEYIAAMECLLADFVLCLTNDTEPKRRKKPVLPELNITRIN